MTANTELDRIFGGEDGESPIRFNDNPLRDASEVQVGRITNDGRWDRRYRPKYTLPEPIKVDPMREVAEILIGIIILGGLWVGILAWVAIGVAAQP